MIIYNDPNGAKSSVDVGVPEGEQFNLFKWQRKSLIAIRNRQVFQQLADTTIMPKHYGKTIKKYEYIPVLDDRNINDQGIDAAGTSLVMGKWHLFVEGNLIATEANSTLTAGQEALNLAGYDTRALAETSATSGFVMATMVAMNGGTSLYGGSKDVGTIKKRLPALAEGGGMVNQIGHSRKTIEGSIVEQGFFSTYTKDSIMFDTDSELLDHIMTESLVAGNELIEDNLQLDLIDAAGVTLFAGGGTLLTHIDPNDAGYTNESVVSYKDLLKVNIVLDDNKCPKSTKMITGSRMIDTRVVNAARYCYVGSELQVTLESMVDLHDAPAWKSVETYARAGNVAVGEEGAIGRTRFIVAQEMMRWEGGGAATGGTNTGFAETTIEGAAYFDVAPMLFVGSGSFSTITFHSSGKSTKFSIIHKKPGVETADAYNDPYGKKGFYSLCFWYGTLILRPEWIALIYTAIEE